MSARGPDLRILAVGAILLAPLVFLFARSFGNDPRAVPRALEGQAASEFALSTLGGEKVVRLSDFKGRPLVVNFWSTWCGPCKIEHPLLVAAPKLHPEVGFVGILYSDEPAKALDYLSRAGSGFDHLADPGGRVAIDFGVSGVPETYFISRDGQVVYKHAGPLSPEVLSHWVGQL